MARSRCSWPPTSPRAGIDVPGVSHVINYGPPERAESYVHRIGRTARAGAEGFAISFCDGEERAFLRDIERLIRLTIPSEDRRGESRRSEPREGFSERGPREARGGVRRTARARRAGRPFRRVPLPVAASRVSG